MLQSRRNSEASAQQQRNLEVEEEETSAEAGAAQEEHPKEAAAEAVANSTTEAHKEEEPHAEVEEATNNNNGSQDNHLSQMQYPDILVNIGYVHRKWRQNASTPTPEITKDVLIVESQVTHIRDVGTKEMTFLPVTSGTFTQKRANFHQKSKPMPSSKE